MPGRAALPAPPRSREQDLDPGRRASLHRETLYNIVTRHYTETMFSIFSKSSKTVVDSERGGVYTGDPSTPHPRHPGPPSEVRSAVAGHHKEYKRERKKSRTRHFRSMFSSDCEDEVTSVVSDNPQLYHRSCSMVSS